MRAWPTIAVALGLGWVVSTFFFALEAWGARGEAKSIVFELWALTTWCLGPLAIIGLAAGGVVGLLRRRHPR